MSKIKPEKLLGTMKDLLNSFGGIKYKKDVCRILSLMEKYSTKLVCRVIYVNILSSSSPDIREQFLNVQGWKLLFSWFSKAVLSQNTRMAEKLINLMLQSSEPPPPSDELNSFLGQLEKISSLSADLSRAVVQLKSHWSGGSSTAAQLEAPASESRSEEKEEVVTDLLARQARKEKKRKKVNVKVVEEAVYQILDLEQNQPSLKRGRKKKKEPKRKSSSKIPFDSSSSSEESEKSDSKPEVHIKVVSPPRNNNKSIKEKIEKRNKSTEEEEEPETKKAKFSKVLRHSSEHDGGPSRTNQKAERKGSSLPSKLEEPKNSMKRKNAEEEKPVLLREVDIFQSLEPSVKKLKKLKKLKPKTPKADSKKFKESSKPSSSTGQPEPDEKGRKRVSWAAPKDLVTVKHFEVDEEERNFKRRFEHLNLKIDKMKEIAVSRKPPPGTPTVKAQRPWAAPQPLESLPKELKMYGSRSEEKRVQKLRESQTLPVHPHPLSVHFVLENTSEVDVLSKLSSRHSGAPGPTNIPLHSPQEELRDFSHIDWTTVNCPPTGFKPLPQVKPNIGAQKGLRKTVACRYFSRGYCKWGDKCRFIHGGK